MSSILNKTKRKKQKQLGWANAEIKMLKSIDLYNGAKRTVVLQSYKDFIILAIYILHIHYGFALKRIVRFESTLNTYLDNARDDSNLDGKHTALFLYDKYAIDIDKESKSVPSRELIKLFQTRHSVLKANDVYLLAQAALFNFLALTCTILKTQFKFSVSDLKKFIFDFKDFLNTLSRVEQFDLTFSEVAKCLAEETGYIDERYVKIKE